MSKNLLLFLGVCALVIIAATVLRRCTASKVDTTTTTETVTTVDIIDVPKEWPEVPDPELPDIDSLIAKGVELDSLKKALAHVASRYTHYKGETLRLRDEVERLRQTLEATTDLAEREAIYLAQVEKLKGRNAELDGLIDSLFAGMNEAQQVRTYVFEERDQYQERSTEVSVVGWLPNGGYQVTKRYLVPTTTTTTHTTETQYRTRQNTLGLLAGGLLENGSFRQAYGLQYVRNFNTLGLGLQVNYLPSTGKQSAGLLPMGGLFLNFGK